MNEAHPLLAVRLAESVLGNIAMHYTMQIGLYDVSDVFNCARPRGYAEIDNYNPCSFPWVSAGGIYFLHVLPIQLHRGEFVRYIYVSAPLLY